MAYIDDLDAFVDTAVVERHDMAAGEREDDFDAGLLEGLGGELSAVDGLIGRLIGPLISHRGTPVRLQHDPQRVEPNGVDGVDGVVDRVRARGEKGWPFGLASREGVPYHPRRRGAKRERGGTLHFPADRRSRLRRSVPSATVSVHGV